MPDLWPFAVLIPPILITLFGGRSAWAWVSMAIGMCAVSGLAMIALVQIDQGQTDALLVRLFLFNAVETPTSSFFRLSSIFALSGIIIPGFIVGTLLLLPAHPRRTRLDLALFWATVLALFMAHFWISAFIATTVMPTTYVDYPENLETLLAATRVTTWVAFAIVIIAAARPILSWWRARKANHAL